MTPLIMDEIAGALGAKSAGPLRPVRVTGVSTDSRAVADGELFFAIPGPHFDGHDFVHDALTRAVGAVVERGRWSGKPAPEGKTILMVPSVTEALCCLARYYRSQLAGTVIAVTGSNGKTTTQSMIGHLLSSFRKGGAAEKSFNNHIGVPLTLLRAETADEYLVVELGSSGPGEIDRLAALTSPTIAVITGVAEAHLAGLRDLHGVAFEKSSVLKHVRRGNVRSVFKLREREAEVMEMEALEDSAIVGKPLRKLKFPKDAIMCAVMRNGEMLIPRGDTVVQAGERVVVFALPQAIQKVEKLFRLIH